MAFEDVYVVSAERETVGLPEVLAAEARLGARFPDGYREYITTLGVGLYHNWIRIYPPARVLEQQLEMQTLWGTAPDARGARLARSVVLGDTAAGDYLFFIPDQPDAVHALPDRRGAVVTLGADLHQALRWTPYPDVRMQVLDRDGEMRRRPFPFFSAWKGQEERRYQCQAQHMHYLQARNFLLNRALRNRPHTHFIVSDTHDLEGWSMLFERDYFGYVYLENPQASGMEMQIRVGYARSRRTPGLADVLTFLDELVQSTHL